MTDLAAALASHGAQALDAHGADWLAHGLASARGAVADRVEILDARTASGAPSDQVERAGLALAPAALDAIGARSPALLRWGRAQAAGVLIALPDDQERARLLALASGLSVADFLATSDASTAATAAATAQREKDAAEVLAIVEEVGLMALRIALPFLLAAI